VKPARAFAAAACLFAGAASAASPPAGHINFVACPILRDTKTVPCWLSEYQGKLYYLGIQFDATSDFYPPYLGHQALVEGVVSDEPSVCGGIVLKPVKVSVIPDLDPSCETMLPAEDRYQIANPPRGPGPRYHAQLYNPPPPPPALSPPYQAKDFVVLYDFDSELGARSLGAITDAMTYAGAIGAKHVRVTGYRASMLLSSGERLTEASYMAEHRAERLADTLRQIGVAADTVAADWKATADLGTGADDYKLRRAVIHVAP
jgi:outer membrane protein OmpA-like peptidoglycan-associated protein